MFYNKNLNVMKNLVKISFVFAALSFALTSCDNNDSDPIVHFWDEPAIVEPSDIIRTAYGKFQVTDMDSTLTAGNLLWTSFTVNSNDKTAGESLAGKAYNFKYEKIDSSKVAMPENEVAFDAYLADDYADSIKVAGLFPTYVDNLLFFGFTHVSQTSGALYDYELILNPATEKDAENHPTLYIRAKKLTAATKAEISTPRNIFGFDMNEFVTYYRKNVSDKGQILFNLKYKIGTNADGTDKYQSFQSNPIKWNVQEKK
jgi:hypothetical protein